MLLREGLVRGGEVMIRCLCGGEGAPLVMAGGFGMCAEDLADLGILAPLAAHFRLTVMDCRGHGGSGRPLDPAAYALERLAGDVEVVVREVAGEGALLWGYSLGAKVMAAAGAALGTSVGRLVLGGCPIRAASVGEGDRVLAALAGGGRVWASLWGGLASFPQGMLERMRRADLGALMALRRAEGGWPDLGPTLASLEQPVLLFGGSGCFAREEMAGAVTGMRRASYRECPGVDHFGMLLQARWMAETLLAWEGGERAERRLRA